MASTTTKRALTTGEVAKFCGVNFRTVIRWIQRGHLKAFQLPGRGDNRVLIKDFLSFLNENDMPVPDELQNVSRRVLIADADDRQANTLAKALAGAGYDVEVCDNAFRTGARLSEYKPAVVVVDPSMDGLSGLDILRLIRADESLQTRVLVVSGGDEAELDAALREGADAVLGKPFKATELVSAINRLVGNAEN